MSQAKQERTAYAIEGEEDDVKSGEHDLWDARMHVAPVIADANARLLGIKVAARGVARGVAAMSASMGRTIRSLETGAGGMR